MKKWCVVAGFGLLGMLGACTDPVENLKPTTFDQSQLNRSSTGRIVRIMKLMPARATVDNSHNSRIARDVGAAAGAGLGAGLGSAFGGTAGGVGGGLGGAILGGLIGGNVVPPQLHPQSLIIVYQDENDPQIRQTVEIAKPCEFAPGTAYAVQIDGQTRIQPNNFENCQRLAAGKKGTASMPVATAAPVSGSAAQMKAPAGS